MSVSDDGLITACAFGELEGADLARIEALLKTDGPARAELEELRKFAGVLTQALTDEPIPQIPNVAESVSFSFAGRASARQSRSLRWLYWGIPLAAAVALGFTLGRVAPRRAPASAGIEKPMLTSPVATPLPKDLFDGQLQNPRLVLADFSYRAQQTSDAYLSTAFPGPLPVRVPLVVSKSRGGQASDSLAIGSAVYLPSPKIYYYTPDPGFAHDTGPWPKAIATKFEILASDRFDPEMAILAVPKWTPERTKKVLEKPADGSAPKK